MCVYICIINKGVEASDGGSKEACHNGPGIMNIYITHTHTHTHTHTRNMRQQPRTRSRGNHSQNHNHTSSNALYNVIPYSKHDSALATD
jgi:hypothetical protein